MVLLEWTVDFSDPVRIKYVVADGSSINTNEWKRNAEDIGEYILVQLPCITV